MTHHVTSLHNRGPESKVGETEDPSEERRPRTRSTAVETEVQDLQLEVETPHVDGRGSRSEEKREGPQKKFLYKIK